MRFIGRKVLCKQKIIFPAIFFRDFFVDFEFKNRVLQKVIEVLFNEAVRRMVAAFEGRAKALYAPIAGTAPGN